jgi:predicted transcriptional regulator
MADKGERSVAVATKLSPKHRRALQYVATILDRSESDLLRAAVIDAYDLDTVANEADYFFADRARLVEHYERRLQNRLEQAANESR